MWKEDLSYEPYDGMHDTVWELGSAQLQEGYINWHFYGEPARGPSGASICGFGWLRIEASVMCHLKAMEQPVEDACRTPDNYLPSKV